MSCQFKDECPSASGWCEGKKQDFSRCIPFLVSAVRTRDERIRELETAREPMHREIPVFECDRRACDSCNPECHLTHDIRHAKNFHIAPWSDKKRIYFVEGEE